VQELLEQAEKELMTINALCDVLATVNASELERNTLPCLGMIMKEAGARLYEYVRKLSVQSFKNKEGLE